MVYFGSSTLKVCTFARTRARMHAFAHSARTRARAHARTHAHTRTRAHTHAHTRTHTHTTHADSHASAKRTQYTQHDAAQHDATQHNAAQHEATQHSTAQHDTTQHNTKQRSHSTAPHSCSYFMHTSTGTAPCPLSSPYHRFLGIAPHVAPNRVPSESRVSVDDGRRPWAWLGRPSSMQPAGTRAAQRVQHTTWHKTGQDNIRTT